MEERAETLHLEARRHGHHGHHCGWVLARVVVVAAVRLFNKSIVRIYIHKNVPGARVSSPCPFHQFSALSFSPQCHFM